MPILPTDAAKHFLQHHYPVLWFDIQVYISSKRKYRDEPMTGDTYDEKTECKQKRKKTNNGME